MDFRRTALTEIARQVRTKEVSAREVASHSLTRIEALNPSVGAFVAVDGTRALEQAAAVDQIVATGGDPGPLAGVPLGVKDSEDAAGYRSTFGSALLADSPVAVSDSVHVARLRSAGCVVVGKTNLPEFAWSGVTDNDLFGPTRNPWNLDHSAGGSSGGRRPHWPRGWCPWPPAPTGEAPSGSPRPAADSRG